MRTSVLLAALVVSSGALADVRGSGTKLSEARKVSDFQSIDASDGVTLEVKKGATSLTIEGDDNIVPLYVTQVVNGQLRIHRKSKETLRKKNELIVRVTTPSLNRLEASGGVEANLVDVAAPQFAAVLSGGVVLRANGLALDSLSLEASGGVEATLGGKTKVAKVNASGGVELKAAGLEAGQVTVDASGGCDLELNAKESVAGEASGGVELKVFGNPATANVRSAGGSDVEYVK